MSLALASTVGPSAYWYLTRSTGTMALILLTLSVVLGVIDVGRYTTARMPRFVVDGMHRSVSLLAVVFLVLHIVTAALDSFASIPLIDAIVPFVGSYRPLWLGLGAASLDLMLAVVITSLARRRLGYRSWRAVHWLAYASWPLALLHTLGTGSDVKAGWMIAISGGCLAAVLFAVIVRAAAGWPGQVRLRTTALGLAVFFSGGVALWLPSGPLGAGWAQRSGTPSSLLHHTTKRSRG
ncbi:MAG TPA: ferric reductase-like transmembrane domain-containing protein [Solirubrobacteraceae bacterium]|jgi:predicted ferric reductase|nr:ferric reductase-like transmembrane domain-containing protein [Solirubrobacteraceae bacterium]